MIDLREELKLAHEQLKNEFCGLKHTLENVTGSDDLTPLAEALLKLQGLNSSSRWTLQAVLAGAHDEFLQDFLSVMNPEEHLRKIGALDALLRNLRYNILDDGYLRIMRLVIKDEDMTMLSGMKIPGRTETYFFLNSDENTPPKEIAVNWFRSQPVLPCRPRLVSARSQWFGDLPTFTKFIETVADPNNWKDKFTINPKVVEEVVKFPKQFELIEDPEGIPRK